MNDGRFAGIPAFEAAALLLVPLVVLGIHWMRSPRTAARGNALGAAGMLGFILVTLAGRGLLADPMVWVGLAVGAGVGIVLALRVRMIQMPELVALFNGIGGAASAVVALLALRAAVPVPPPAPRVAAFLATGIGTLTFAGSLIAVFKLARWLPSRPVAFRGHATLCLALLGGLLALAGIGAASAGGGAYRVAAAVIPAAGLLFGVLFMVRVGGADMPVSISLLNALSGVAAAVAGFAVGNPVPVAVGAMVGTGGLMLTRIMCRAMNRELGDVLAGRLADAAGAAETPAEAGPSEPARDPADLLAAARRVAIVPGYGMALAQAQPAVKRLFDLLEKRGVEVVFAIHPVAGRMPGHMHILLAEVNLPYERFLELDEANARLPETDVALVVGANDVVNPSAGTVEGTPISGMPILRVTEARAVVVCNLDRSPGYAGVPNPLYDAPKTTLCLGDAAQTLSALADALAAQPASA